MNPLSYRFITESVKETNTGYEQTVTYFEVWRDHAMGPHGFGKTIDDAVLNLRKEENMQPYR